MALFGVGGGTSVGAGQPEGATQTICARCWTLESRAKLPKRQWLGFGPEISSPKPYAGSKQAGRT